MEEYYKKENENELEWISRIVKNRREYDLDYTEVFKILFGLDLAPDECRKRFYGIKMIIDKIDNIKLDTVKDKDIKDDLYLQLEEIKKEKMKVSDERSSLNRRLRESSQKESYKEIAEHCAKCISEKNPFIFDKRKIDDYEENQAILTLSDIHYGLDINKFNNKYNPEICKERFETLKDNVIKDMDRHNIKILNVLGLGDMIEGIIHNINRVESRENLINQIIGISELISQFLNELSKKYQIYYYDVIDNHSRVFPKYDENSNEDNFALLIKWYLKSRFEGNERVIIKDNEIDESIGTLKIFNKDYCFVHGNMDKISDIVQNLSLMTKRFYDGIFIGHMHHFEANETHGTYIYMSGTFAGNDEYANNGRTTSNPSQNLFIINKDGIFCQYLIRL